MTGDASVPETRTRTRRRSSRRVRHTASAVPLKRFGFAVAALVASGGLAACLALQPYPRLPALLACLALAAMAGVWPSAGLVAAFTLIPVADLTAVTGMLYATESDLVVSSVVAGMAVRFVVRPPPAVNDLPPSGTLLFAVGLLGLSYAVSTALAVMPLPPVGWHTFSGFSSVYNGLRLAKGFVLGVLLLACTRGWTAAEPRRTITAVSAGLVAGLALASLAATWERIAFVQLTDFASDYRTTALFWEMQVGGAQFDGWIAATMPFALWWLATNRKPAVAVGLAAVLAVILYGALTTFSRALYLALAVEVVLLGLLAVRRPRTGSAGTRHDYHAVFAVGALIVAMAPVSIAVFETGGYRGLAATLAGAGLVFAVAPRLVGIGAGPMFLVVAGGAAVGSMSMAMVSDLAKVPYGVFAVLALVSGGAALLAAGERRPPGVRVLAGGSAVATAFAAPHVSAHWGEATPGLLVWLAAFASLVPLALCRLRVPALYDTRWPTLAMAAIGLLGLGISIAVGQSYYAGVRFSTLSDDMALRQRHWRDALALSKHPAQWLAGIGTGRFSDAYYWQTHNRFLPGGFRVGDSPNGRALSVSGPNQPVGWGELLRISQRITADARPPFRLEVNYTAEPPREGPLVLHTEVCRKLLLYNGECAVANMGLQAGARTQSVSMPGSTLGPERALGIPRPTQFAMGLDNVGGRAFLHEVRLYDASGRQLLKNGAFERGMSWWFFSSERAHLAYHAKNLWLHAFVEQGLLGLVAVVLLPGLALLWLSVGPGRSHPLAAPCVAALAGFGVVAISDSLIDAPRLTLLFTWLGGFGLSLRAGPQHAATAS